MKNLAKIPFLLFILLFIVFPTSAQSYLSADGVGNTYELINSVFAPGYNVIESPDVSHTDFGKHIDEIWDDDLQSYVFRFHLHVTPDNDRGVDKDRQRNEIKTYDKSPNNLKGIQGERVVYKWKFKLDEGFQASNKFTHIHQIKAKGGTESGMPQITLTPRAGSPDKLQVLYAKSNSQTEVKAVALSLFKGVWVDVTETISYGENGTYQLIINRVSDGQSLVFYENNNIRMWKTDAEFMRPKWGIYRSLKSSHLLRDEEVLFADFSIEEIENTTDCTNCVCKDISKEDFENDFGIWNDSGNNRAKHGEQSKGEYSIRLQNNNTNSSAIYTDILNLSTYDSMQISFSYYPKSMENGEDFFLEISNDGGGTYIVIEDWIAGQEFSNDNWYDESITINSPFGTNSRLRFRCDASDNDDHIYLDDIRIEGCSVEEVEQSLIGKYRLRNIWRNNYLSQPEDVEGAFVNVQDLIPNSPSQIWDIEHGPDDTYRLRCNWNDEYLNVRAPHNITPVTTDPLNNDSLGQTWYLEATDNVDIFRIKNRWSNRYLHASPTDSVNIFDLNQTWSSLRWELIPVDSLISSTTITRNPNKNNIIVYPNPASQYVKIPLLLQTSVHHVQLFNIAGQVFPINWKTNTSGHLKVSWNTLPSGIYFIKVKTEKEIFVGKVMVE